MILSGVEMNVLKIRNRQDLSIKKTIEHGFGYLYSGICYSDKSVLLLGIDNNLVEFDYQNNKFTKNIETQ